MTASLQSTVTLRCDGGSGCLCTRPITALSVNAAREFLKKNEGWSSVVVDGVTRDFCRRCEEARTRKAGA